MPTSRVHKRRMRPGVQPRRMDASKKAGDAEFKKQLRLSPKEQKELERILKTLPKEHQGPRAGGVRTRDNDWVIGPGPPRKVDHTIIGPGGWSPEARERHFFGPRMTKEKFDKLMKDNKNKKKGKKHREEE